MRTIILKTQFKRDLKRARRNPRQDIDKLDEAISALVLQGCLPSELHPHPLSGSWVPAWECHIQPDFLLIYQVDDETLTLVRCGSHAELFGK